MFKRAENVLKKDQWTNEDSHRCLSLIMQRGVVIVDDFHEAEQICRAGCSQGIRLRIAPHHNQFKVLPVRNEK